jgi:hypothetical protein
MLEMSTVCYDTFVNKQEAIDYYKSNFKNLEDKPDWLVETMIEFSIKYPDYSEYVAVENKILNKQPLTDYEQEKYGSLEWVPKTTQYRKNQVIRDAVDILEHGQYPDIARDPVARETMNKYGLDFGTLEKPSPEVTIKMACDEGSYLVKALVEDLNNGIHKFETIPCDE